MNLQPISGSRSTPFTFTCCKCGQRRNTSHDEGARADLSGPPYAAYYCGACVAMLSTPAKAPESVEGASPSEREIFDEMRFALRAIIGTKVDKYGYHAAGNVLDDDIRARATRVLNRAEAAG